MISFPAGTAIDRRSNGPARLDRADVHIWSIDLSDEVGDPGCLSREELARAETILLPVHRRRFVACRSAVRSILGGYLGRPAPEVAIDTAKGGKPRVTADDNPLDLRFNLSHSGDLAVLVIASGVEVGIDVEAVRPIRAFERMVTRCLAPAEREAILHQPPAARDREFMRYWTHKEAYLKAQGAGIVRPLSSIVVDLGASPYWRVFDHSGVEEPSENWVVEMEPEGEMVGAVAWLDGTHRGIEVFAWNDGGSRAATAQTVRPARTPEPPAPPAAMSADGLADWLAGYIAKHLGVAADAIDAQASFESFALDSAVAIEMTGDLERLLGRSVDPMLVYDYPTIEKLADHLASRPSPASGHP